MQEPLSQQPSQARPIWQCANNNRYNMTDKHNNMRDISISGIVAVVVVVVVVVGHDAAATTTTTANK